MNIKQKIGRFLRVWATDYEYFDNIRYEFYRERLIHENLHCHESGISTTDYGVEIIVSLTTFGRRINEVFVSIESIMQGTLKPNRIVLWLQDDYKNLILPITLQNQIQRGLEIRFCKDIKSYKKLIPSLAEFPEAAIVTIDDDLIYPYDTLENLIRSFQQDPSYIYASRYHRICFENDGTLKNYNNWIWNCPDFTPSHLNFVTTGAGTLFPPHCFSEEIFNEAIFSNLCPHADDVWVNAMALLNGIQVKRVFTHDLSKNNYLMNQTVQDSALSHQNVDRCQNDIQFLNVYRHYNLFNKLKLCKQQ